MKEKRRPIGHLYVLSNPAMPGILKIGFTDRPQVEERVEELSRSTSVPLPFEVEYDQIVENPLQYERLLHARLDKYRVSSDKEFFRLDRLEALETINEVLFGSKTINIKKELEHILALHQKFPDMWTKDSTQHASAIKEVLASIETTHSNIKSEQDNSQ